MGDKITRAEREELFRQSTASQDNREDFAESWAAMINLVLPVETTVRSIFTVEVLAPGAVPVYTVDVQPIEAWYLPKFGQAPQNIIEVEEVTLPTFELTGSEEYRIRDATMGRINVADRAMQRLTDSMVLQEELAGWSVLSGAATAARTVTGAAASGMTKPLVDAAFELMETNRSFEVTDIYVGPDVMADIRSWTQVAVDPLTQREIFVNAGLPSIYGATIHVVHFLTKGEAYFLDCRPDRLGYMPIRAELRTFDDPTAIKKFRVGTIAYEEIGFGVMDNRNIVKAALV